MMKQISFEFIKDCKKEFGGSLLISKRKVKRPLSTKHPLHLILRSENSQTFPPGNNKLESALKDLSRKYNIKIFHKSFNWNHFHTLIQVPSRQAYNAFMRRWTSEIVKIANQKGIMNYSGCFKLRPYTRVGTWGRDFINLKKYQNKNNQEAWGLTQKEFELLEETVI